MTILVTGGAGFIGGYLIKELLLNGQEVISLDCKKITFEHEKLQHYVCDLTDESQLKNLPQITYTVVYHLAAVHTTPGHEPHEYYEANVTGSLNLLRYLDTQKSCPIIFLSSISVYGTHEQHRDERSPVSPTSDYGRSKLQAERIIDVHCAAKNNPLTIIRPGVVFGTGEGGNFDRMSHLINKGYFIFPGRRDTRKACIYVKDLVDIILNYTPTVKSGHQKDIINGCYDEAPSIDELVSLLSDVKSKSIIKLTIPEKVLKTIAIIIQNIGGSHIGIHPERVAKLTISNNITSFTLSDRKHVYKYGLKAAIEDWQVH